MNVIPMRGTLMAIIVYAAPVDTAARVGSAMDFATVTIAQTTEPSPDLILMLLRSMEVTALVASAAVQNVILTAFVNDVFSGTTPRMVMVKVSPSRARSAQAAPQTCRDRETEYGTRINHATPVADRGARLAAQCATRSALATPARILRSCIIRLGMSLSDNIRVRSAGTACRRRTVHLVAASVTPARPTGRVTLSLTALGPRS